MTKIKSFFKHLFNRPEYGVMAYDEQGFYRRFARTGEVEFKAESGWREVAESHWWQFKPRTIGKINLACGQVRLYDLSQRDTMGEKAFSEWLQNQRRIILEKRIMEQWERQI